MSTVIVPIKNTEFVRDMDTKAVLNTDAAGLIRYKQNRKKSIRERQDSLDTKNRIAAMEQELISLKQLISELANLRSKL